MARFVWRLQRVLDIRQKEEQGLRSGLMALGERMVILRQEIMVIRTRIRTAIDELSEKQPTERVSAQQFFMKFSQYSENEVNIIKTELATVEKQRKKKMDELLEKRQSIKALEKLRAKAKEEFLIESGHKEQQLIDEYTSNKFGTVITAQA